MASVKNGPMVFTTHLDGTSEISITLFALSLAGIKNNNIESEFDHISSYCHANSEEEAEKIGREEAELKWPVEDGWDFDAQVKIIKIGATFEHEKV